MSNNNIQLVNSYKIGCYINCCNTKLLMIGVLKKPRIRYSTIPFINPTSYQDTLICCDSLLL